MKEIAEIHIDILYIENICEAICIYNYLYMWSSVVEKRIAKTDKR